RRGECRVAGDPEGGVRVTLTATPPRPCVLRSTVAAGGCNLDPSLPPAQAPSHGGIAMRCSRLLCATFLLACAPAYAAVQRPVEGLRRVALRPSRHPARVLLSEVFYDPGTQRPFVELLALRETDLTGWKPEGAG